MMEGGRGFVNNLQSNHGIFLDQIVAWGDFLFVFVLKNIDFM